MKQFKYLIIIVVILALVFIGVGFASGASIESIANTFTSNEDYIEQDPIVYSDVITMLDIDAETRDIVIESTTDVEITILHYEIDGEIWNINLTGGVLMINQMDEPGIAGWFNWRIPTGERNDIIIYIPETYLFDMDVFTNTGSISVSDFDTLNDVTLETDTGSINVSNISSNELDISSDTGSINLQNIIVSGDTILETDTGSITAHTIETDNLAADINTGTINITLITANQMDLLNDTGSINVNDVDLTNRTLKLKTDTGSINVNGVSQGHTFNLIMSNQSYYINAETDTGSININE